MEIADAQAAARRLLDKHGLHHWQLCLDNAHQRCGACHFSSRTISLSRHFIQMNSVHEVNDTILHEIAHALTGPGSAHGQSWQNIARQIGAKAGATNTTATMPDPRWRLQCLSCERVVARRHRRSLKLDRTRCSFCGIELGKLQWLRD